MKGLCLSLCFLLIACGGEDLLSSSSEGDALVNTPQGASDAESSGALCVEGEALCLDERSYGICGSEGVLGEATLCEPDRRCFKGECRLALCEADEVRCASWTRHRSCDASGVTWGPPESCPKDQVCHEGQCLTCVPEASTCATLAASVTCSADGLYFPMEEISSCPGDEHCHEPSGVCLETSCTAGQRTCAGSLGFHDCLPSATLFSPEISPCESTELCAEGVCTESPCVPPPVLFVVDRTSAVGGDWQAFESAIKAAQEAAPSAAFGFMPFPMAFGCPSTGSGALPRFPVELNANIDMWFQEVSASAGEAALQHTFETLLMRAQEIFNVYGGKIVLISSGSADCDTSSEELAALIEALRFDHGVTTYVIGHRASLGPYPALDAAHAAGGSAWETWKESSYDFDLTQAILAAMEETPECAQSTLSR